MDGTRKSSLLVKITVLFVICCFCLPVQAKYGGGTGESNDPYLIYTAGQMNAIGADSNDWDKHFLLCADIDLGGLTGTSFNIIGNYENPFTGVFDGNGHTISNFSYTSTGTGYIGLFGYVSGEHAGIKNLGLIDPNVDRTGESWHVGSLVGWLRDGTITNCYVEGGSVVGYGDVGGLVGLNRDGTISNCYATGSVSGYFDIGGMVGDNDGTITDCHSISSVTGGESVGGLVGNSSGTISNCCSSGSVSGAEDIWNHSVGGLAGYNSGKVSNSYSIAGVSGDRTVGGLVGRNSFGCTITNCYSIGSVLGSEYVGGLVGDNSGHVISSYWDIETSGQADSSGGKGKTTEQMMMEDNFVHWGTCDQVWTINEGADYPRLVWENKPGEPIVGIIPLEGDGAAESPYLIYTAEELSVIGLLPCLWDKHFKLMANIDLSQYTCTEFNIIVRFTGTFDGNYHTISNFSYTSISSQPIGLFGYVDDPNAEIKNLGLIDPNLNVRSSHYVGSLVGELYNGTISNCYVGGGSVSGEYSYHIGGLVGCNSYGTISECYSTCDVSGYLRVGGFVGWNYYGTISMCYSSGRVSGPIKHVGGLVGNNFYGEVTDSFWDIETSGQVISDGGTGLPTDQMQMASTFTDAGWDFQNVWWIIEGAGYPRLCWEDKYGGGSGRPNDPYLIYTAEQMNTIGACKRDRDKHFKLMADVDLGGFTGTSFNVIGTSWDNAFTGVFDGNGHTISNFTYTSTNRDYIGLFGYVYGGVIKNLGLIAPNVDAGTGRCVGPLVGIVEHGTISNCYVEGGSVSGDYPIGGLVGFTDNSNITNSYATGSMSGDRSIGGLAGFTNNCNITNSYATGSVSGDRYIGGLVGLNMDGSITNCYSTGSVSGDSFIGGLVGEIYSGTISNCYATSMVTGDSIVGGLVGSGAEWRVVDSFWDIEASGRTTSAGGTGLPTAQMQMMSTFTDAGWDFVGETTNGTEDIWFIPEGDYPHLWWERMQVPMKLTPGTLNCRSKGGWVKAHFVLPADLTVEDVDSNILGRIDSLGIEADYMDVFVDEDGFVKVEMAFDRVALCEKLTGGGSVEITVRGFLTNGLYFYGTETMKIK